MSYKIILAIAFLLSCQANAGATDSALAKSRPEPVAQQVKTDTSTQNVSTQTTSENWEPKDIALVAGVVVTLLLGIWNALANFRSGQRTIFVNTVTSQRIKWIEQLRQDISSYSGLVYHWVMTDLHDSKEEQQILKEVDRLNHVIRLRLNPKGTHDKAIDSLLAEIPKHTADEAKIRKLLEQLTVTSQALLKEEWEKVKDESQNGPLSDRA